MLLITNGWAPSGIDATTEIVHLDSASKECNDLPDSVIKGIAGVGGLLHNQYPLVCGGNAGSEVLDKCFIAGGGVDQTPIAMRTGRKYAASVVLNGDTLWITGGSIGPDLTGTTEYVTMAGSADGPDLPVSNGVDNHCMVAVDSITTYLIGGRRNGKKVFSHNSQTGDWTTLSTMASSRDAATCGALIDSVDESIIIIMVTGGNNMKETETMQHGLDNWVHAFDFPTVIRWGSSVTTANRKKVVVFGYHDGAAQSKLMYTFQCFNLDCQWTEMAQKLSAARRSVVGILVPEAMGSCHYSHLP